MCGGGAIGSGTGCKCEIDIDVCMACGGHLSAFCILNCVCVPVCVCVCLCVCVCVCVFVCVYERGCCDSICDLAFLRFVFNIICVIVLVFFLVSACVCVCVRVSRRLGAFVRAILCVQFNCLGHNHESQCDLDCGGLQ